MIPFAPADEGEDPMVRFGPDGLIRQASAACRRFGLDPERAVGQPVLSLLRPLSQPEAASVLKRLFKGEDAAAPSSQRYQILEAAGEGAWVEASHKTIRDRAGAVCEVIATLRDVTDRVRSERALAESEARYRLLADISTDIILRYDRDARIEFASPAVRQLGFEPDELLGRRITDLVHEEDAPHLTRRHEELLAGLSPAKLDRVEFRARRKDGGLVWLEASRTGIKDESGRIQGAISVIRDMSAHKELEQELIAARRSAEAAAQAKGDFLANMSHEIRTPLTAILGFSSLLADRSDLSEASRQYVDRIRTAGQALLATVVGVLDLSRLEAGQGSIHCRPTRPVDLVSETIEMFAPEAAAKGLALELTIEGSIPGCVSLDPDRVRQILVNFLGNAVKFTAQGRVQVTLSYDFALSKLRAEVADTGPGVQEADLGKLFERFGQIEGHSPNGKSGTGLGLAISKRLAEALGGEIGVTSQYRQGSTFWIAVPAPETAEAEDEGEMPLATSGLEGVRVLVVDDNVMNLELAETVLLSAGAAVTTAKDGESALAIASVTPFDFILLDNRMPGLDGVETLRRVRAGPGPNRTAPVVAFSADLELGARFDALGYDDFISKPLNPALLLQSVSKWTRIDWFDPALSA